MARQPLSQAVISGFLDQARDIFRRCAHCLYHSNSKAQLTLAWPSRCQMNSEPGAVRKWKLADVSRVVVDGVEVDIKRVANEFVRDDGQPVQLVLEFREEQTAQRKANARRSNGARTLIGHPLVQPSVGLPGPR